MNLDFSLLPYQKRILLSDKKFVGMISGTGAGKTHLLPRFVFYKMLSTKCNKVAVSSPTIPMIKRNPLSYFFEFFEASGIHETKNRTLKLNQFKYNRQELEITTAFGKISFIPASEPKRFQGFHGDLFAGDEDGLMDIEYFNTIVQRASFHNAQIAFFTTWYELNWLYDYVYLPFVNGDPNYHLELPKTADNIFYPKESIELARKTLPDRLFRMFYLNEVPTAGNNQLFDIVDINNCKGKVQPDGEIWITIDVAYEGDDTSVLYVWNGFNTIEKVVLETNTEPELRATTKEMVDSLILRGYASRIDDITIAIDTTGVGVTLYHNLSADGYNCQDVNFARTAYYDDAYANTRAEIYIECQKAVKNGTVNIPADDEDLHTEMKAQQLSITKDRRFILIPKELIKKKIQRSCDSSDAFALRFYPKREFGFIC